MANISKTVSFDMLEKLADGTYKLKYPKTSVGQIVGIDDAIKVKSVNGKIGAVSLSYSDVDAMQANAPGEGSNSIKIGVEAQAFGRNSVALGRRTATSVNAPYSVAIGNLTEVIGENAVGILTNEVTGDYAIGIGYGIARGENSYALGRNAVASNKNQAVFGLDSTWDGGTNWTFKNNFTVSGTKNFEMEHPNPAKKDTHMLRHAVVETPSAGDNLYRYKIVANQDNDVVIIDLPDYFVHLNKNVQTWITGHLHFGNGYGVLNRETEKLEIYCELAGQYNVLVIGTRNDDNDTVQEWDIFGAEREKGISWRGETYAFEVDEILEVKEIKEVL